jgi:hypothetical protein
MINKNIQLYQIKIKIKGIYPPVWRRILVPSIMALSDFHRTIQIAMGWENVHQYRFILGRMNSSAFSQGYIKHTRSKDPKTIQELFRKVNDVLTYEYDFNDEWEHEIKLEKILPLERWLPVPFCMAGKRACPPENCGGVKGYYYLTKDYEYLDMATRLGHPFKPEEFNLRNTNENLARYVITDIKYPRLSKSKSSLETPMPGRTYTPKHVIS